MESVNASFVNATTTITNVSMGAIPDIDSGCGTGVNSSVCQEPSLGIRLSTPILMLSFGVLGNILALAVLYTAKKEVQKTVFYTLLAGLAWTDMIGQLLTGSVAIIVYANNLQWVGGQPMCVYHAFMMICFGMITPVLVCSMSLERLLALRCTYFYSRHITRRKAQVSIIICWVMVIFFATWPLMGFGSYEHQFPGTWCFLNFHRQSGLDTAYAYTFSIFNVLIIATIILCNFTVVVTLLQMRKNRKINNSPSLERRHGTRPKRLKLETETQMVWFLCAITLVFSTCWLPLNVIILINQITGRQDNAADLIGVRMASINQILDPWLYILLRKAMFLKIAKQIKVYLTRNALRSPSSHQQKSRGDVEMIAALPEYEINVVCHGEKSEDFSSESLDSVGSTSSTLKLIQDQSLKRTLRPPLVKRSLSADPQVRPKTRGSESSSDSDVFNDESAGCFLVKFTKLDERLQDSLRHRDSNTAVQGARRQKRLSSLPADFGKDSDIVT